jgi:hypothetical protein
MQYMRGILVLIFSFLVSPGQNMRRIQKVENVALEDRCTRGTLATILHEIVSKLQSSHSKRRRLQSHDVRALFVRVLLAVHERIRGN